MTTPTHLENRILEANGGRPWTIADIERVGRRRARTSNATARYALGMTRKPGEWVTTDNDKMSKDTGAPAAGVTYAPATELRDFLTDRAADGAPAVPKGAPVRWDVLAELISTTMGVMLTAGAGPALAGLIIGALRRFNPCPWATPGCIAGCVIRTGGNGRYASAVAGRSARLLTLITDPGAALWLTLDGIRKWTDEMGPDARWRWGVGDDVRWELVAPELFSMVAGQSYLYTKAPLAVRPSDAVAVMVRSATGERGRWTPASIAGAAAAGERVAVVFGDVRRGQPLPTSWHGVPVIDGDATDDRTATPAGAIAGLRAKGAAIGKTYGAGSFAFAARDGGVFA